MVARLTSLVLALVLAGLSVGCASGAGDKAGAGPRPPSEVLPALVVAMKEVCFPYVLEGKDGAALLNRRGVFNAPSPPPQLGGPAFMFGSPNLFVAIAEGPSGRGCALSAHTGFLTGGTDPEALRAAMLEVFAGLPFAFTQQGYQYPPNSFARRETFCAPPQGPHALALVSTAPAGHPSGQPALIATFSISDQRNPRCDGVPPTDPRLLPKG